MPFACSPIRVSRCYIAFEPVGKIVKPEVGKILNAEKDDTHNSEHEYISDSEQEDTDERAEETRRSIMKEGNSGNKYIV